MDDEKSRNNIILDKIILPPVILILALIYVIFENPRRVGNELMFPIICYGIPKSTIEVIIYFVSVINWFSNFVFHGFSVVIADIYSDNIIQQYHELPGALGVAGFIVYIILRFKVRSPAPNFWGWFQKL